MNIEKFIGIRHKFNGRSFDGADCIGLCHLFYTEHNYSQVWNDGKPITENWHNEKLRLLRFLRKNFTPTDNINDLQYGDIVLFDIDGDVHLGIYLRYGKILAMQVPVCEGVSESTIYSKLFWQPYFYKGFLREKGV